MHLFAALSLVMKGSSGTNVRTHQPGRVLVIWEQSFPPCEIDYKRSELACVRNVLAD
jgi:hypothetical protein